MKRKELAYSRALVPKSGKMHKKVIIIIVFLLIIILTGMLTKKSHKNVSDDNQGITSGDIIDNLNFMGIEAEKEVGKDLMEIDYIDNLTCSISYPEIGIEAVDSKIREIVLTLKNDFILMHRSSEPQAEQYFQYIGYKSYLAPENKISIIFREARVVNEANSVFERNFIYLFDLKTGDLITPETVFKKGYKKEITNYLLNLFETPEYKGVPFPDYKTTLEEIEKEGYKLAFTNNNMIIYFDKYEIMAGSYGVVEIKMDYDVLKDYLLLNENDKFDIPEIEQPPIDSGDNENIRYATATVNVRSEATVNSKKLGTLQEGEAITIISADKDWTKVLYEGVEAYVNSNYLSQKRLPHYPITLNIKDRGIDPTKPMVAITYDDGPNPISTPRILDTLEKHNAVATFFDLGQLVNTYSAIVKREESLNCEIGNHTYSHANLNILSPEELKLEIQRSEKAFEKAIGYKPTLLRPAYGNVNAAVKEVIEYPFITWNVDSLDWKSKNKDKILAEIRKTENYDGKIILMHSIYGSTADATEVLVPELIEKGYQLVTISELAYYKGKTIETGKVYTNF